MYSAKYIPAKIPHPSVMMPHNKDSDKFHTKKLIILLAIIGHKAINNQ